MLTPWWGCGDGLPLLGSIAMAQTKHAAASGGALMVMPRRGSYTGCPYPLFLKKNKNLKINGGKDLFKTLRLFLYLTFFLVIRYSPK